MNYKLFFAGVICAALGLFIARICGIINHGVVPPWLGFILLLLFVAWAIFAAASFMYKRNKKGIWR